MTRWSKYPLAFLLAVFSLFVLAATANAGTREISLPAIHDGYVREAQPTTVFNNISLEMEKADLGVANQSNAFLSFTIPALNAGESIASVTLGLATKDGSGDGPKVWKSSANFNETTLTWNNKPGRSGSFIGDFPGNAPEGDRITIPLTPASVFTANATHTIEIEGEEPTDLYMAHAEETTGTTSDPIVTVVVNTPATQAPRLDTAPTSLSFSGVENGSNPAAQSLNITNGGDGTMTFSATDNQSWLSVTPTSGTAPGSVSVSVNTAGLADGTYNGTVTISSSSSGVTGTPDVIPVTLAVSNEPPTPGIDHLLIDRATLLSRPIVSDTAWTFINNQASSFNSTYTGSGTTDCQLRNYENTLRFGQKVRAAAYVAIRTGNTTLEQKVEDCLRRVIGSETVASTDGTAVADGMLSTARNLPAFVDAMSVVQLPLSTTGTRTGFTTKTLGTWLSEIQTKTIGTHTRWFNLRGTMANSASNWGAASLAAVTFAELYRTGGTADAALVNQWKRAMGDATVGSHYVTTQDYDSSWSCQTGEAAWPTGRVLRPINSDECGSGKSGIVVEDASRSASAYPTFDADGKSYSNETMHFLTAGALAMEHAGYDITGMSDKDALGNALSVTPTMARGCAQADAQSFYVTTFAIHKQLAFQCNALLGTSYTTDDTYAMGRMLSFSEWVFDLA